MKIILSIAGTVFFLLIVYTYFIAPSSSPEVEHLPALKSFELEGFDSVSTEFWYWDGGQFLFIYLKQDEPIAYFHAGELYIAYDADVEKTKYNKPKVFVYDVWRGDKDDDKCKQVFAFCKKAGDYSEIKQLMDHELKQENMIRPIEQAGIVSEDKMGEIIRQLL